ncbi:unnamed protein product [Oppiella nova]|uniref:RBR-type E3 ubiquitin transferase n=1 Tax=Oppiella nova TaxID=334625 RepID=A0A7R9QQV1_9ACAR|nr:unnamed protein product [Oppiella nova]CAG2170475.1 unnamed protein product [Oppiella nova]
MGGNSSKFRKYVENGDEASSLKLIEEHREVLKTFNPNDSVNEWQESSLLLCCKWSMTSIVKTLLYDCGGDPNRKNVFNQTALHLVCQIPVHNDDESTGEALRGEHSEDSSRGRRAKCLQLILDWNLVCETSSTSKKSSVEPVDINALDRSGNTALHFAVTNGLMDCVKILVDNDCELFIENQLGDTACDVALKYNHLDVLRYLEFKMVFSSHSNAILAKVAEINRNEDYLPLKWHDLQDIKNQLTSETSHLLNVSLSSAEVLLRSFDWSQESLIDHWFNDSEQLTAKEKHLIVINTDNEVLKVAPNGKQKSCEICSLELGSSERIGAICGHQFCLNCWRTYLELKIECGETSAITCPAFNCSHLVTHKIIETVVSRELIDRFMRKDIESFIESNPTIQWCPHPACDKAVLLPESKSHPNSDQSYVLANMPALLPVSHAVECTDGHNFCWECRREAHSPCDCKLWEDWMTKISDIKAEELKQKYSRTEDAANSLWLVRNAKQCPRCKAYIQKSEGCNHLRCSKCKYDFCWICLESWKKHNSGTGGYFRCNRSEAAQRAEQNICLLKRVAEQQNCEIKELKKFVFHYTKYKFNIMSAETQTSLIDRSRAKQRELFDYSVQLSEDNDSAESVDPEDDFLCLAAYELIRGRNVLCGSAVYGYYLEDHGYNKAVFEYMENNLNIIANRLSETISGSFDYLRNSRNYIIDMTNKVKTRRLELLSAVCNGLIPPETPPGFNKHQRRHCLPGVLALDSMENLNNPCDENDNSLMSQAIISSLSELNDKNSWIQDKNGRHNNLFAIYDWPDDCHVDYSDRVISDDKTVVVMNNQSVPNASKSSEEPTDPDVCSNRFCAKPRVQNPRTGQKHEFCSLKCKYLTEDRERDVKNIADYSNAMNYPYDPSMDLLLAIEMSKLSYEEEKQRCDNIVSIESEVKPSDENQNHDTISENPFEMFVEDIKTNPSVSDSSAAKTAIMFFLKSSFNDIVIDDKNLNPSPKDFKTEKKLFSVL